MTSLRLITMFLLLSILAAVGACAEDKEDKEHKDDNLDPLFSVPRFIYPAKEDLKFFSQDNVNVSYYSDYDKPTLYFWCIIGDATKRLGMLEDFPSNNGWNVVRMPAGVDSENCWFNLKTSGKEINSVPFALSSTEPTKISQGSDIVETSAPSRTETESPRGTATRTGESSGSRSDASEEPSQTSSGADNKNSGLSMTATIGIGVGVSLGVLGAVALITACWLLRRRRVQAISYESPAPRNEDRRVVYSSAHPHEVPRHPVEWYESKQTPYTVEPNPQPRFELP